MATARRVEAIIVTVFGRVIFPLGNCGWNCKSVPARRTAPSMGRVAITRRNSVRVVLEIAAVEVVNTIVGVTVVMSTDIKVVVNNNVLVVTAVVIWGW
uniref:Uncharacterized protein n=1 Tax=Romanomermis culicivorax TaxID=13658 RepID=A0A915K018_ROMCU